MEPDHYPEPGRTYTHYKGGRYKVEFFAQHSETQERLVIYRSLNHGSIWARPIDIWMKPVESTGEIRFKPE